MPLQQLTRIIVENNEDGTQVTRLPSNQEMMNKINEIVKFINDMNREKQDIPIFGARTVN